MKSNFDIIQISDYAHLYRYKKPSSELLIVFSAINTPPPKFLGTNVFTNSERNILFLNCPNDWYINGVPGMGSSINDTINGISSLIINELPPIDRIITFGGSMGGYGALLYGAMLDADFSICFGAETILSILGGVSRPYVKNKRLNLKNIIAKSKTKVRAFYGEYFIPDILCGLKISQLENVEVSTVKNKEHPLPAYLHQKYNLTTLVDNYFSGTKFKLAPEDEGSFLNYSKIIKLSWAATTIALKGKTNLLYQIEKSILNECDNLQDNAASAAVFFNLSKCFIELSDYTSAEKYAAKAVCCAENSSTLDNYVQCLHKNNDENWWRIAVKAVASHQHDILHDPTFSYENIIELIKSNQPEVVEELFNSLPEEPRLHIQLSHSFAQTDKIEKAIKAAETAISFEKNNPAFYHHLGNLLLRSGDLNEAEKAQRKALILAPELAAPYMQLSHILSRRGDLTEAITMAQKAILRKDDNPYFYHQIGNLFLKAGNLHEAEKAQCRAVELNPDFPGPHMQLSHIYRHKGDFKKAISKAYDAIALKDDNPAFYKHLNKLLKK